MSAVMDRPDVDVLGAWARHGLRGIRQVERGIIEIKQNLESAEAERGADDI